ncbi:archaetidylserine decarboxylase [Leptospira sp. GIMC2001]|uniref:archaetidylserine decarboxylase n=1 Tax=Leptospira sp. GIMC2001 TaxID=1513297 RepID=UPI00234A33C9|nr:archaetidylserine decarboxylase [Leptospira sp. GIMC2001]WCL50400.1 archaetidylserine decarboxylase [Leptospira sp. GIMC2001]
MDKNIFNTTQFGFLGQDILNPYFYLLIFAGLYMTVRLGFPQFRFLFLSMKILTGNMDEKGSKGQIVHSQSFFAGVGSSLLLGSFLGTALALMVGGIGAMVWIWIAAIVIMPLRFVSSTLAIRFRQKLPSGRYLSGPMYFIEKALKAKWLAMAFGFGSVVTVLLFGAVYPMIAVTYISQQGLQVKGMAMPIVIAAALVLLVLGGIRRVGKAAGYIAPAGIVLFVTSFFILFSGQDMVGAFFSTIFHEAFRIESIAAGGFFLLFKTMAGSTGLFFLSTETGVGKSAGVSGVVRTDYPAKHGLVSMLATFAESFIFAPIFAYILYTNGAISTGDQIEFYIGLLSKPLEIGSLFLYTSLILFGLLSLAGWFYTGEQNSFYVMGDRFSNIFRVLFVATLLATSFLIGRYGYEVLPYFFNIGFTAAVITSFPLILSLALMVKQARLELNKFITESGARYEVIKDFYLVLLSILPKNFISKLFGLFSMMNLPRFIMIPILKAFAKTYKINLDEAELEIQEYNSLNQFFTRALRAEARIIDSADNAIVSPVDARITAYGEIRESSVIQAKGIDYSVTDLIGSDKYKKDFINGKFMTFYLSPQDYHRIHSPSYGKVLGYYYEPGKLFPVNDLAVLNIQSLFPKNERLITFLQTEYGKIAVVKVGASNVGKIRVTYDNKIVTNSWIRFSKEVTYKDVSILIDKGGELGRFEMGSTVILVFEKDTIDFVDNIVLNDKTQYGNVVGYFRKKIMSLPKNS